MSDIALFVIDLQRDFLEAGGRQSVGPEKAGRVIETANRLVKHAAMAGWQIIFIKNEFSKNDWLGNLLRGGPAIQGSPRAEMDPRVMMPENASIIRKNKASAFTNPALDDLLRKLAIRHVILLGVMTEACVRATAKAARSRGFQVTLVSDAVASRFDWLHRVGLIAMRQAGVEIKSSSDLLPTGHLPS
jgi:nicotinamidase-related amidase